MGEVIQFNKVKMEKQYQQNGSLSINLALDTVVRKEKRDIAKELQLGYMRLLSNRR